MSKKYLLMTVLLILTILTSCQANKAVPGQTPTTAPPVSTPVLATPSSEPSPSGEEGDWSLDIFRQALINTEASKLEQLKGASIYLIDLEIAADYKTISGHEEVRYTNREDKSLEEIYFRLFANSLGGHIQTANVRLDGQPEEAMLEAKDSALRLPLAKALSPGQSVTVSMDFDVTIPTEFGGNYGLLSYIENILALDSIYPVIPAYDEKGWQKDYPPPNGDLTYNDASFYQVRLVAPAGLVVVSSGTTVQQSEEDGKQKLTILDGPARDFYIAASPDFIQLTEKFGETQVNSYAFASNKEAAQNALKTAINALRSYSSRFTPYPYKEYDIVSTPMLAMGIEYPGIVGITTELYEKDAVIRGLHASVLLESVVAHETAHQWFYDMVGNDQWNEPWLDESVAQYVTNLYYLDTYGDAAAAQYRLSWNDSLNHINQEDIPIGLPAGAYQDFQYSPIVYNRGPIFLMALAKQMGQSSFDAFLRQYVVTNEWKIVTTEEFRKMAESQCSCDLGGLFNKWVYPKK
jgi:hypothetical protein